MRLKDITIERMFPSGAYLCSGMFQDQYYKMRFIGYTKKEALSAFNAYIEDCLDQ